MATEHRECSVCGVKKPLADFKKGTNYSRGTCRACRNDQRNRRIASNPATYLYSRLGRQNRSKNKPEVSIDKKYIEKMWEEQSGKCDVTGVHMTYQPRDLKRTTGLNASIDRIDPSKGYCKGNVRIVCHMVNVMRNSGDDSDLLWWCKMIVEGIEGG
jgi:hypothetical protein